MKDVLAFWRGPIRGCARRARVHTRGQPVYIPLALTLWLDKKQNSLLGTVRATTKDAILQPQGIGPDNPCADTELVHSLVVFQYAGNSSETLVSSCSSSFSFPLIPPSIIQHGL